MKLLSAEINRNDRHNHIMYLLLLEIEIFKKINVIFGHPTGVMSVEHFTALCHQAARKTDTIARIGDEAYALLLPEVDNKGVYAVAERKRSTIEQSPIESKERSNFNITASIILTDHSPTTIGEEKLIKHADNVLHKIKTNGRSRVVCA
jgi:diguanylate cyclase (GGDEF)-like protein